MQKESLDLPWRSVQNLSHIIRSLTNASTAAVEPWAAAVHEEEEEEEDCLERGTDDDMEEEEEEEGLERGQRERLRQK